MKTKTIYRRSGLIGTASLLALVVGLQAASADTTASVASIAPGATWPVPILNNLTPTPGTGTASIIGSLQSVGGLSSGTATTTGATNVILTTAGSNSTFNNNNNALFALTRGNNVTSSLGTNSDSAGAVILNAQQVVPGAGANVTSLASSTTGNINSTGLLGNGTNVTGRLNNNSVQARVAYNSAFATLETTVPLTLNTVAVFQGHLAAFSGTGVEPSSFGQVANYNVASMQASSGFTNGAASGTAAATVDDTLLTFSRIYTAFVGTPTISGTYRVNGNVVDASAVSNAADNGILLESGVASTFSGTAFASSTQLSRETTAPVGGALPAISASNTDTIITANFFNLLPGLLLTAEGQNLNTQINNNQISSSATINTSYNLVGFDSALSLAGDSAAVGVNMIYGVTNNALAVFSDNGVVNHQNAYGEVGGPAQSASAETDDASVLFFIEGVAGNTTITMNGNALAATAQGNVNTNLVINHALGGSNDPGATLGNGNSATIDGTFSAANRQLIYRPDIEATMSDSEIQALIGTLNVGGTPFGGFVGGTLRLNDNSVSASANGNVAVGLVDLQGQSVDTSHGALITGATVIADREDGALAQVFGINPVSGVMVANLQFNAQAAGPAGSLLATVRDNTIEAIVADDDGTVEDWEIDNAILTLNGNTFRASSTVNGFTGTANLTAVNSMVGDASVSNSQTVGGFGAIDVGASLTGNTLNAVLGIADLSESLTVRMQDNQFLALANGNEANLSINIDAGSINAGTMLTSAGNNATILPSAVATQETLNTEIRAAGGYVIVNDQAINFSDFSATASGNSILLALDPTTDDLTSSLADTRLDVSGNDIIAQVLGNNAVNRLTIDAGTSLGVSATGAIGGIVSSQTGATVNGVDITLTASAIGNSIGVSVLDGDTADGISNMVLGVESHTDDQGVVHGNTIASLAYASRATNAVTASASSISTLATGVSLTATNGAIDQTVAIDDSALYVLNRQRNEALNTAGTGRGASVDAITADNAIGVFVNSGATGVEDSRLRIQSAAVQANAGANVASNSIDSTAATSSTVAAGILSRQGNSGDVTATNSATSLSLELTAGDGTTHSDIDAVINGNLISSGATGNSASNTVSASAGTSLNGTNGAGAAGVFVGSTLPAGPFLASVQTGTGSLDSNNNAQVLGNLGLLNSQRNYGLAGDPSVINSSLTDPSFSLTVSNGDVTTAQSTLSLSGNEASSQATANAAQNTLKTTAGTGSAVIPTLLNLQSTADTTVSASALNASMATTVDGTIADSTVRTDGNLVLASAQVNTAVNRIETTSTSGILPSSTILNVQESAGNSVSASNSGTSITQVTGLSGFNAATNSTFSVSGNQIGSAATINNATNTVGAPGQSFTRTSSF